MTTSPHITTDHDEIRRWIQAHHGAPARDATGALRIDFLGVTSGLEHLFWSDWFATFDEDGLIRSPIFVAEPAPGSNWCPAHAQSPAPARRDRRPIRSPSRPRLSSPEAVEVSGPSRTAGPLRRKRRRAARTERATPHRARRIGQAGALQNA